MTTFSKSFRHVSEVFARRNRAKIKKQRVRLARRQGKKMLENAPRVIYNERDVV